MTIWVIVQIIYSIAKCYYDKAFPPKKAVAMMNNPGVVEKILLRKTVNDAIRKMNRKIGTVKSHESFKEELLNIVEPFDR